MNLKFPELRGGPVQGLNDAGVENFQGAIDVYVSRECGQNTGDAHRPGVDKARLEFSRIELAATDIPGFPQLQQTLESCMERWGGKEKERDFFEQAIELAGKATIPVLKISDFGTTGLTGDDDDEKGRWFALVKSQGVSNKENTAGGSFGIGKSSPFAASRFRTVFYGTRTEAGKVALQGVSRLVTHRNPEGKLTQGVGFIGEYDPTGGEGDEPLFKAIRDEVKIPTHFKRDDTGTDIWVIGYRSGDEWSANLISSIITNFWPAIHRGLIEFKVGDQEVTKDNLSDLLDEYSRKEDFEAHHFYKALISQPLRKTLNSVGECELFLTTSISDLPRKICMARGSGMRIYDYQPRACRVPFSGLFICTDDDGNKLLRKLEPPKHDIWDPKRVEDGSGKRALDEIKTWIREEVKKLNPLTAGKSFNENELAKYLADSDPDELSDLPEEQTGESVDESLEPKPRQDTQDGKPATAKPVSAMVPGGEDDGPGNGQDGDSGGAEENDGGGGDAPGDEGQQGASTTDTTAPSLQVRSYYLSGNRYVLVLRSAEAFKGRVLVRARGEDGKSERVRLTSAAGAEDNRKLEVDGDTIRGIAIRPGQAVRLTIEIDALTRRALSAVAQV